MQPTLYNKILKLIKKHQLETITVDIFDMALLYEYWPAELRYFDIAKLWLPELRRCISTQITTYEIYDWHRYSYSLLLSSQQPLRIDLWLDTLIDLFCLKYNVELTNEQHLQLLASLIATELDFVIHNTCINHQLLAELNALKQLHPKLKIYFTTNSCYTSEQIKTLLEISKIKVFTNGYSTCDVAPSQSNTPPYQQLLAQFPHNFNPKNNLHIGAHRKHDYLAPIQCGSHAVHYRPLRLRGLRTLIGKSAIQIIRTAALLQELPKAPQDTNGATSQASLLQAWQLFNIARFTPENNFLVASDVYSQLLLEQKRNDQIPNVTLAPELTRSTIIKAFVWMLATYETARWDAPLLLQKLTQAANITSHAELYQLCFGNDYPVSQLALSAHDDKKFWSDFLTEIANSSASDIEGLRQSYITASNYLPRDQKSIFFVYLCSDNTAWLFQEFAQLHQLNNTITAYPLYLYNTSNASSLDHEVIESLKNTNFAPDSYINTILKPRLSHKN